MCDLEAQMYRRLEEKFVSLWLESSGFLRYCALILKFKVM
jgi:hypothetical protein